MSTLFRTSILAALLLTGTAFAAGHAVAASASIATVNGVAITKAELNRTLLLATRTGVQDSPQLRQALKAQLISRELFRQAAEKQGLAKHPEVEAMVRDARASAMMQVYLEKNLKPEPVTDASVKARYDQIVASLGPTEYKPRIVQTADEAAARKVLDEIIKRGAAFDTLARQYSKAPSAAAGGELAWVSFKELKEGQTQGLPLPLAQAITGLTTGMVSAVPIKLDDSWVVLKVDQARPTQVPEFKQIAPVLRQTLEQTARAQAASALTTKLIKAAKIQP